MRKLIDRTIAFLFLIMTFLLLVFTDWRISWYWIVIAVILAILHLWWSVREEWKEEKDRKAAYGIETSPMPASALTEIVLLGEDDTHIASWNIYGKNGLVIGRDIGENHVSINLEDMTYASMVDIEHAVLNYSGDQWFVEDISEKNGVSVQKRDGKKYKLSYGKPCRLESGDIIYIALVRLKIL